MACLKTAGTHPELRDVLTKDTTLGPTVSKTSLTKRAGILSRGQFVGRSCLTMSERWENVTGSNCWKTAGQKEKIGGSVITVMGGKLRPVILSTKYFRKFSHKIKDGTIQSESRGLTRELKTLKRTWGRCLLLATTSKKKNFTILLFFSVFVIE